MVAFLDIGHTFSDFNDYTGCLMTWNHRKLSRRVVTRYRINIRMTEGSEFNLNHYLAGFRILNINLHDLKGFTWFERNSCFTFHHDTFSFSFEICYVPIFT